MKDSASARYSAKSKKKAGDGRKYHRRAAFFQGDRNNGVGDQSEHGAACQCPGKDCHKGVAAVDERLSGRGRGQPGKQDGLPKTEDRHGMVAGLGQHRCARRLRDPDQVLDLPKIARVPTV
jgi:hypothetical protein